jgi:hypothetical protein
MNSPPKQHCGSLFRRLSIALLLAATLLPTGCVRRRLAVRSNPPGALVFVDNQEIGTTPCSVDFTYYGTREIRLVKPGYETLTVNQPIPMPWYQIPPIDFVSENLMPNKIEDHRTVAFDMQPQLIVPTEQLLERANQLRAETQQSAGPPTGALPAGAIPAGAMPPGTIPVGAPQPMFEPTPSFAPTPAPPPVTTPTPLPPVSGTAPYGTAPYGSAPPATFSPPAMTPYSSGADLAAPGTAVPGTVAPSITPPPYAPSTTPYTAPSLPPTTAPPYAAPFSAPTLPPAPPANTQQGPKIVSPPLR